MARPARWQAGLWAETKRLKWAIVAAVIPIFALDVLGLRFDIQNELRWVPLLQKMSVISFALIIAHLSWRAMFYYLDMGVLYTHATNQDATIREGLLFGAVVFSRVVFYLAVILGFTLGL